MDKGGIMNITKVCTVCSIEKTQTRWHTSGICKECNKKRHKKNWAKSPKGRKNKNLRNKRYWLKSPQRKLFVHAKSRAKNEGIPFSITLEDVHAAYPTTNLCPVFGMELVNEHETVTKGGHPNSPSLDRINPKLGYVPGNIRVVSWRANRLKNNMTFEEVEALYNDFIRLQTRSS